LINTGKAENAVQVTKALQDIKNHPISSQVVCCHFEKSGIEGCGEEKTPSFFQVWKEWLDFVSYTVSQQVNSAPLEPTPDQLCLSCLIKSAFLLLHPSA
ncbi:hypothetical protein PAXRUDRAFT_181908, partial [Paxillus rubicundulus Ve08.2h10]